MDFKNKNLYGSRVCVSSVIFGVAMLGASTSVKFVQIFYVITAALELMSLLITIKLWREANTTKKAHKIREVTA